MLATTPARSTIYELDNIVHTQVTKGIHPAHLDIIAERQIMTLTSNASNVQIAQNTQKKQIRWIK